MFWLIILIMSVIVLVYWYVAGCDADDSECFATWVVVVICLTATMITSISGCNSYKSLIEYKDEIKILESRINEIKRNYCEEEERTICKLETIDVSSPLADKLVDTKIEFNKLLSKCKMNKNIIAYWWFTDGMFIFEEVLKMKKYRIK